MQGYLLFSLVFSCISALEERNLEKRYHGMNVITQCVDPGMIALTYDDGVSKYTPELLEVLKSEKVRATFFVLGSQLAENKSLARSMLKKMWDAGHDVGSHTYSHPYLTSTSEWTIKDEMEKTDNLISEILGVKPLLMRPPYGDINYKTANFLESMGYTVVNWNIDSDDWRMEYSPASEVAQHVIDMVPSRSSNPGRSYIILYHDTVKPSVEAQRAIIRNLKAKGYKFGNMSECLGGPSVYRNA